jgi:hypothetical protein
MAESVNQKALPHPSHKSVSFPSELSIPLKDYASKLTDLRSPVGVPLANFQSRRFTPLFGLSADPQPISPHAGGQPKRSITLTASEISNRGGTSRAPVPFHAGPWSRHKPRQPRRIRDPVRQ